MKRVPEWKQAETIKGTGKIERGDTNESLLVEYRLEIREEFLKTYPGQPPIPRQKEIRVHVRLVPEIWPVSNLHFVILHLEDGRKLKCLTAGGWKNLVVAGDFF